MLVVVHPVCKCCMPGEFVLSSVMDLMGGNDWCVEEIIRSGMLLYVIIAEKMNKDKK